MIPYITNKNHEPRVKLQELNDIFSPLMHSNMDELNKMTIIKNKIYTQLNQGDSKRQKFDKIISDPTELGRYMNFRGASSNIANYIKGLDKTTRSKFVISDQQRYSTPQRKLDYNQRIKQIENHNEKYTLLIKQREGLEYYDRSISRQTIVQSPRRTTRIPPEQLAYDSPRIHGRPRGRLLKPVFKISKINRSFQDSPKSIKLQAFTRSQLYDILGY